MEGEIPPTVPAAVRRAAARWPDQEAVVDGDRRVTWAGLADRMTAAARAVVAAGVGPGERVALWAPNSLDWIVASLGVYAAGAVLVPINTRFTAVEAAHVLGRVNARLLITVTDFLGRDYTADLAAQMDLPTTVVLSGPAGAHVSWADFLDAAMIRPSGTSTPSEGPSRDARPDHAIPSSDTPVRSGQHPGDTQHEGEARERGLEGEDVSDVIFTSGTTGRPKGAMLTHGASTRTYTEWSAAVGLQHGDRYLVVYPFFHCAGLKSAVLACVLVGATIVPCPVFDVDTVMRLVERERISMLPGPPSLYQSLLNADLSRYDRSTLRLAVTGASAVPVELVRRIRDEIGCASVVTAYGLTETTGTVSSCRHDDPIETIATTSGRPIPGMAVRVVDQQGVDVPTGQPGEVLARGFAVMRGYWADPAATAEAIDADGWLHTGDVGVLDDAGNVRITDRIKDMYIVGGFNAYPAEIENVLAGHEKVAQVAVVGAPDDRLGEVGYAFVVPRRGVEIDTAELIAWSKERLANYKVPRHVEVVDELPLNRTGKVIKFELRERAKAVL
jgi:acyl-CoA synthetase (AMP-forming)/AMP-acid ligase II